MICNHAHVYDRRTAFRRPTFWQTSASISYNCLLTLNPVFKDSTGVWQPYSIFPFRNVTANIDSSVNRHLRIPRQFRNSSLRFEDERRHGYLHIDHNHILLKPNAHRLDIVDVTLCTFEIRF
ncbi:unnamed protein product [Spodoptera littoralis]|uniref:Uncharacterized protein n=1 Tax=Spodoptera littoralis TaxID=7109 RepID=A0A9P0I271_SPOLI|nr:unnamed protein product [Spodoptera littoralis]CAH1638429.1 unnamed protein product [Spodoptera littoralis]